MYYIFIKGMALGLVLATLIGPVFFALIDTSIKYGFRKAFFMALGISLSDTFYIIITYAGMAQFSDNPWVIKYLGVAGGVVLILAGIRALTKKNNLVKHPDINALSNKERLRFFMKGFSLNFLNPAVFLFWVGVVGAVSLDYDYYNYKILVFFCGTIITVFATDIIKIQVAKGLSAHINDNLLIWMGRTAGVLMTTYGCKLIYETIEWSKII
ncbi:MAG: LysE family translocator [Cytophagales bacterium]|nr:LysE family translocator [Cytophagales bacterium]